VLVKVPSYSYAHAAGSRPTSASKRGFCEKHIFDHKECLLERKGVKTVADDGIRSHTISAFKSPSRAAADICLMFMPGLPWQSLVPLVQSRCRRQSGREAGQQVGYKPMSPRHAVGVVAQANQFCAVSEAA